MELWSALRWVSAAGLGLPLSSSPSPLISFIPLTEIPLILPRQVFQIQLEN